jgi:hypothetical protein
MKKISLLAFILLAVGFLFSTTGCDDDTPPEPPVVPVDTTEVVELNNQMKVGFDLYKLNINEVLTDGFYSTGDNTTVINVSGNDGTQGDADFTLTFPGKTTGSFSTQGMGELATFEAGTGAIGDVRRIEMNAGITPFTIEVTEYGAVGEKIIGTFSGTVKNTNSQSIEITEGKFEVTRENDR